MGTTHVVGDANSKRMMVIRSLSVQLVPFKPHGFEQQGR